MISPTRPAISWPAPDAPLRDALPGDPGHAVPDDFTEVGDWLQERTANGA